MAEGISNASTQLLLAEMTRSRSSLGIRTDRRSAGIDEKPKHAREHRLPGALLAALRPADRIRSWWPTANRAPGAAASTHRRRPHQLDRRVPDDPPFMGTGLDSPPLGVAEIEVEAGASLSDTDEGFLFRSCVDGPRLEDRMLSSRSRPRMAPPVQTQNCPASHILNSRDRSGQCSRWSTTGKLMQAVGLGSCQNSQADVGTMTASRCGLRRRFPDAPPVPTFADALLVSLFGASGAPSSCSEAIAQSSV